MRTDNSNIRWIRALGSTAAIMAGSVWMITPGNVLANALVDAAADGDLVTLEQLLAAEAAVNEPANDGSTALLWATYQAYPEMLDALLAAGADPNLANNFGVTPLLQAARTGDSEAIAILLAAGADPAQVHPDGETPLMAAAGTGVLNAVALLLAAGADPNQVDDFQAQSALMRAAAEGHGSMVEQLLEAGADPNLQARINALSNRTNADFPSGGLTALMWATRNGHADIVRQLAAAGADLDIHNGDGASATTIAIVNDRFDLAAELIELGASVNDGALYRAVEMRDATTDWYARDGSRLRVDHDNNLTALGLIEFLLAHGADPNQPHIGQMHSATMCCDVYANGTATYRAAVAADVAALELLLAHGGDPNWAPSEVAGGGQAANGNVDKSPLIVAITGGKGVPLSAGPGFSRVGPPPFREPSDRTPAHAVQLLLAAGADPNFINYNGNPVVHEAVIARDMDVLRALIESGADLGAIDRDGKTALERAEEMPEELETMTFGPRADDAGASPAAMAELLRTAMQDTAGGGA